MASFYKKFDNVQLCCTEMYMAIKQGYALKNWVEEISDEAYNRQPLGVTKKDSTKISQPYICHRTIDFFLFID